MKHFLRNLILLLVVLLLLLENSCVVGFSLTTFAVLKKGTKHNANNAAAVDISTNPSVNKVGDAVQVASLLEKIRAINDDQFNIEVLSHAGLSVVIFTSSWCGPCKAHLHTIEEVLNSQVLTNKGIKFLSVDTDENPVTSTEFQVRSIPSTMMFKNGRCVSIIDGAVPKHVVEAEALKHSLVNLPDVSVATFE